MTNSGGKIDPDSLISPVKKGLTNSDIFNLEHYSKKKKAEKQRQEYFMKQFFLDKYRNAHLDYLNSMSDPVFRKKKETEQAFYKFLKGKMAEHKDKSKLTIIPVI